MKKFTELERNLITAILDGRRSDFKKEQDFEKVFGRNANIDLVEGRGYLLEDSLFGEGVSVPDIIGDLLYETEVGNIHYDVMIDALEAAVNEAWANVPSEEEAIYVSNLIEKLPPIIRRYYVSLYFLRKHGLEEGIDLSWELRSLDSGVLSALGIECHGSLSLVACLQDEQTSRDTAAEVFRSANWSVLLKPNFSTLECLITALKEIEKKLPYSEEFDAFTCQSNLEEMAFLVAGCDPMWMEFLDNGGITIYDCETEEYIRQIKEVREVI
ncbi:hypothetical protein [Bacillus paralicheniformis]|uniref:hypothetical protein n=1 Tax=Bacillus paralicheniformis TaxID=1648923 RepID=UPI0022446AF1|nr:hypothetical protein [Bacillus paralicheniformis]MEC1023550.1 hypothetical protein [Bacillus paralicheniformis]MEC1027418.1 hypothetical protein [Bacillus paralicheniformis]MEC1034382.1 hypothetical protein [Bacillus paralicheniformis]MEC1050236.1 hypothetical protein [Bacillus paralicheniformis]MEC1059827.1 hypothetical protein [Bacillus paralicheniformis]